jgi:hypothetical protein
MFSLSATKSGEAKIELASPIIETARIAMDGGFIFLQNAEVIRELKLELERWVEVECVWCI